MGFFKIKTRANLDEMSLDAKIPEADFTTITPVGNLVQLEYVADENKTKYEYEVEPGIWSIGKKEGELALFPATFVKDKILTNFLQTEKIRNIADCFFSRLHIYKKYGIEVPKRGVILYGPAGGGKSSSIINVCENYVKDGKTLVVIWPTDKFSAIEVKSFINSFVYKSVDKLVLVMEDLGGIEMDNVRLKSESSLLSLLDNKDKTFSIPVLLVATTNHIEIFQGNLTNRPDRFDDKIEIGFPSSSERLVLLKFFLEDKVTEEMCELIQSSSCEEFTPAHIRDIGLRMDLFDMSGVDVIRKISRDIAAYKNSFTKDKSIGLLGRFDED
jgi:hypothetical protein